MFRPKLPIFEKQNSSNIKFRQSNNDLGHYRFYFLVILSLLIFSGLYLRLFQLTMIKGGYYRFISESNRIKEIDLPAPRGNIFDQNNINLAKSQKTDHDDYQRIYFDNQALAPILGYIQIASQQDLKTDFCQKNIGLNDSIGKQGIEKRYDCVLRGKKGKELIEVDVNGNKLKTITKFNSHQGTDIFLSLDAKLQQKTYQIISQNQIKTNVDIDLDKQKIAVIGSKPDTGEILIYYSHPSFDPTVFHQKDNEKKQQYINDNNKPLFNRISQGTYPPGSVIKPILALAALEEKIIDENFTIEDTGIIKAGPQTFGNWYYLQYGKTDGDVNVIKALKRSNDIFFYKIGAKLTPQKIKKWFNAFGIGNLTDIGFDEQKGLIPSAFWKQEILAENWYLGDTYNMSIGQGYLLTTPIQINKAISAIANNGVLCQPKLIKNNPDIDSYYNIINTDSKSNCLDLNISQKNIDIVKLGMKQACQSGGTAWPFFEFKVPNLTKASQSEQDSTLNAEKNLSGENRTDLIDKADPPTTPIAVGCKTGTAESHAKSGLPHAWFSVFAPFDEPEIVLTVLVEEAGEGSNIAAPIAKEILQYYFEQKSD